MTRPRISGISPFFIVADVAAAISFYRDMLDFEVTFQEPHDDPFFVIVSRDGTMRLQRTRAALLPRSLGGEHAPLGTPGRAPLSPQAVRREIMDLASALPLLLPQAIAWAQAQADEALAVGLPLGADALENARRVGVQAPERIRVKVVDALPLPENPVLRDAALQAGLLGPGMVGLTLGYAIFICKGHLKLRMLSHECRHVYQYESHGGIAAFLPIYLAQIVAAGYAEAPFEVDARNHEISPA